MIPTDLHYAQSHEWLRVSGDEGTVGISDHAQAELTDVVYVELPKVGARVEAQGPVCVIESVKAASDIFAPVSGTISAVNQQLSANPALINSDPYGGGWIFKIKLSDPAQVSALKTPAQYGEQLGA